MWQSRRRYAASAKAKLQATDINYLGHKARTMLACLAASDWPATTFAFSYPARWDLSVYPPFHPLRNPGTPSILRHGVMEIADRGRKREHGEHGSLVFFSNNRPPLLSPSPPLPLWLAPLSRICKSVYLVSNSGGVSINSVASFFTGIKDD